MYIISQQVTKAFYIDIGFIYTCNLKNYYLPYKYAKSYTILSMEVPFNILWSATFDDISANLNC